MNSMYPSVCWFRK